MNRSEILRMNLQQDKASSQHEIEAGFYSHADRDLNQYRAHIPGLDSIVESLLRQVPIVTCLDAGCGTSRAAAELSEVYRERIDVKGVTLVIHPPIGDHATLPREKIFESSIGKAAFADGQFNLVLAVGSIDTSNTVVEEGRKLLELTARPGIFIFAPTTVFLGGKDCDRLMTAAKHLSIRTEMMKSSLNLPVYLFIKQSE